MSAPAAGLGGVAATRALARLAWVRAVRGKALWIGAGLAVLPVVMASVLTGLGRPAADVWRAAFEVTLQLLVVVPAILIGPSLADELEDKTSAYLWSRALPRWSIVAGKLLALAPAAAVILTAGLATAWAVSGGPGAIPVAVALRGLAAVAVAGLVGSMVVAAIATLVPRYAVATAVVWLLFVDGGLGLLPTKLQHSSVSFASRAVAGFADAGAVAGVLTFGALGALAVTVAVRRLRTME